MKTSLYIHIPFCRSKCSYCDFFSVPCGNQNVPDEYIASLCNEIKIRKAERGADSLETVYIGGGTPSILTEGQLFRIMNEVFSGLRKEPEEITVEANPDDISKDFLDALASCGVTRISCGIQTFNGSALKNVKRRGTDKVSRSAAELIKIYWKGIFSADLISGLPGESEKSFLRTLDELLKFKPEHISMYSLTLEEETPLGKSFYDGTLEYDFDMADKIWIAGRNLLIEKGYGHYEVSNFCLPGFECRHNLAYWNQDDYIGCGAGGTGTFYGKNALRFTNTSELKKYVSFWKDSVSTENAPGSAERLSWETQAFEFFMMGLRTLRGISREEYERRFSAGIPEKIAAVFKRWTEKGLCREKLSPSPVARRGAPEHFYSMTEEGILFLNRFLEEIL